MCDVMCGATHPRNSLGLSKECVIFRYETIQFVLDIAGSYTSMVRCWMMLSSVIGMVVNAFVPEK